MNKSIKILLLVALAMLLAFPAGGNNNTVLDNYDVVPLEMSDSLQIIDNGVQLAGTQDLASWWNSTFIYRRYFNFTEASGYDRTSTPVHLYLTFDYGHCYADSLRVGYYDDPDWTLLPFQTWNTTYYDGGEFIQSTQISFMVNVSASAMEQNYYVYYAKIDAGSVSYPDFYPFIYKSYTYSLLNLISYYDNNNYLVEKWDASSSQWDDPRNFDNRWSASQVTPDNVPNGTLNEYEVVRYEPTAYSNSPDYFWGYYTIYSKYPLSVSAGQGNIGSNPAVNDWWPGINEMSTGTGTHFVFGGVEGFDDRNEGKYWVQAMQNNTEVNVWTTSEVADTGWLFHNGSSVDSWPAILNAGEYVSKRDVLYTSYMIANSTKPISIRQGDVDSAYSRDVSGFYSAIDGNLAGEEFYIIDMGNSNDYFRVTNLGDTSVDVDWRRNSGSGWGSWTTITIDANKSQLIPRGAASDTDPEDILHIKSETGSMLMVEGVYYPTNAIDAGDWVPSTTGHRFGSTHKLWGINGYKFFITATENAEVQISGYNSGTLYLSAGEIAEFRPVSGSMTLYHITSNVSVGVHGVGRFSTSSPYGPTGDTGYGWSVPASTPEADQNSLQIDIGGERNLFEFDITVEDLDGSPVEGVAVTLYNVSTSSVWLDDQGNNRTGITDSNGLAIFEGLNNGTYEVRSIIDATQWLSQSPSITNIWVSDSSAHAIAGSITPVTITLNMASVSIHLEDLMGVSMDDTLDEDIYMRLCNDSSDDSIYLHQAQANSTGWLDFPRIPQDDYYFRAKYTGENTWNSYGFDDLKRFANWTIESSDFSSGSWDISDWVLPLGTLEVHVHSWDDKLVPNAYIQMNNTVDELDYTMTESSDANGNYNFTRIVNGTWQLNVWRDDDFGIMVVNNTNEVVLSVQGYTSFEVQLRLTTLNINVITQTGSNNVPDATVTVWLNNVTAIAYGQTDSSGNIVFAWIHGNMTTPSYVWYTVDVEKGTGNVSRYIVKADSEYAYINQIKLPDPTYSPAYTALTSSASFETQNWYLDYLFTIDYFNRTGDESDLPENITYDGSTLIQFEIWLDTTLVGYGNWTTTTTSSMSKNPNNSTFTITIGLDFWGLNASETAYKIIITAHTTGYNDPDSVVVYLTVLRGDTTYGSSTAGIVDYYGSHGEYLFWLEDDLNGNVNLTSLDVYNFTIKLGLDVLVSGYLYNNGNGTFSLLSGSLNGLDVGSYVLVIELGKLNYDSVSTEMTIVVNNVPMQVASISTFGYDWALTTQVCTFEYIFDPDNTTNPNLSNVAVTIEWFSSPGGVSYLNVSTILSASGGIFTYTFNKDILPVGQWTLEITCSVDNYAVARTIGGPITVSSAPTTLVVSGSDTVTVDWLEEVVFDLTFTRNADVVGLTGASYTHNWTGAISFEDLGAGLYRVKLDTSIAADTYGLEITLSLDNHQNGIEEMTITILIPLLIETEYGSFENPLQAYWTANFTIEISLVDQSTGGTPITGATVSYDWFLQFVVDLDGPLTGHTGGIYNITLDANDAVPSDDLYTIIITANYTGGTQDSTSIFVHISAVPNEIVLDVEYFEQYYADVFDVRFYWNNTLDGDAIDSFDLAEFNLITLGTLILTGVNEGNGWYHFTVDTKALEMNANEQGSVYVIQITMTQSGFAPHDFTAVIILVRETDASLIIDSVDDTYWSDTIDITANLYDALHGGLIWEGTTITLTYGTESMELIDHLNGTFTISILASDWFAASVDAYTISFSYGLPNYVDSTNSSTVIINPIAGSIIFDVPGGDSLSYTWTETFILGVRVNQIYGTVQPLLDTNVYYIWSSYSTLYQLAYQPSTFDYGVSVDTAGVPAGSYNLIIRVINENYTIADVEIPIVIETVNTDLSTDILEYEVLASETGLDIYLEYVIDDDDVSLTGALSAASIVMEYAGTIYTATYQSASGLFRLTFNPSEMDVSSIPGVFILNITASLTNYTTLEIHPTLRLIAPTTLSGPAVISEETSTFTIWFQFISPLTGESIGPDQVSSVTLTTPAQTFTLEDFAYNGTHYSIVLTGVQIGPVRAEAYELILSASATGFEEQVEQVILVTVTEQTVDLLGLGFVRIPMSLFTTIVFMTGLFLVLGGVVVGIQRWRIPFQIKQINKALKSMQNNKIAKVEGIKSMGDVVSELLAPGLAELDISAPTIDMAPETDFASLGAETEGLLDELDALDDIGLDDAVADEATDYEAELEAELDSEIEETHDEVVEATVIDEEVVSEPEVDADEVSEDVVEEPEDDSEVVSESISEDVAEEGIAEDELDAEVETDAALVSEDEVKAMAEKLLALGVAESEVEFLIENAQSFTKPELESLVASLELKQLEDETESEDEPSEDEMSVEEIESESETSDSDEESDELEPMDEELESSEE